MGNVLLREDRSVALLVAGAVTRGFREAGYRVLAGSDPDHGRAPAVEVVIRRFWTRMDWTRMETAAPGVAWDFSSEVWIQAPAPPFQDGSWVCGKAFASRGGPTPGMWEYTVRQGLEDLVARLRARLVTGVAPPYC